MKIIQQNASGVAGGTSTAPVKEERRLHNSCHRIWLCRI